MLPGIALYKGEETNMELQALLASLPRGKEDKPLALPTDDLTFDPGNIDGAYSMLDPAASGCVILMFSKDMDPAVSGRAFLDGAALPKCILKCMPQMMGLWVVGIGLRGYATEYGKTYTLRVEGFADTHGNVMDPQEFPITLPSMEQPRQEYADHEAVALQAAREGIVLLKNNGALPLQAGTVLNLFGKGIYRFRSSAAGAGQINPRYRVNLLDAAQPDFKLNRELVDFYRCDLDLCPDLGMLERARALSDTAVMLIERGARENMDNNSAKGGYYLTDREDALICALRERFKKLIVILNVGHPIDVGFAEKYSVDALLYNGFGGMLAGKALVDVLSGRENPSGKLPDTWAKDYFDIPASRNFYDSGDKPLLDGDAPVYLDTVYEESIYVGYRYFHTFGVKPAYPFGFGLSYTGFSIQPDHVGFDGRLQLQATVTNTGDRPGREVVQVYVRKPETLCETPERELCWFGKTKLLQPGESQMLRITVEPRELTVFDCDRAAFVMPAGEYGIFVGNSSLASPCGSFTADEITVRQVTHLMQPVEDITGLTKHDPASFPRGERSGVKEAGEFAPKGARRKYPAHFDGVSRGEKLTFADLKADPASLNAFVSQLSVEELARLSVCGSHGWKVDCRGEAGFMYQLEGLNLPRFPVSDGNSGVNLRTKNIGMPSGATMAAAFDPELMERIGRVIGEEARELGIPLILAPGMNLHRNPLCGRQPEYFSEDPYLAGVLAGHYCRGLESAGVGSCIKHLAANNCESARKRNQSLIPERALRELYLKSFQVAMQTHMPASVMTAYNAINGCHTATDEELLQGFLREENGFDGMIMTDWNSYDTMDVADAVDAGNCWMTPGSMDDTYVKPIIDGVESGRVRLDRLRENVAYIIKTMVRFS